MLCRTIKSQRGSTLIQVMVAGAVLLGTSVYLTKNSSEQEKLIKTATSRSVANEQVQDIDEVLTDPEICKATFSKSGALTGSPIEVSNKDGSSLYKIGDQTMGGKLEDLKLINFISGTGLRHTKAKFRVTLRYIGTDEGHTTIGGQTKNYDIPIYIVADSNVLKACLSDNSEALQSAFSAACSQFGGTLNTATGICENLVNKGGVIEKYIQDYFCSSGTGCNHPYAGQSCSGKDVRGESHNNWVISGFDGAGKMECTCMPKACPNPASYCLGQDLGTDWCNSVCPSGVMQPNDYAPDPSTVCSGESFTQSNSCGQTSSAVGSKSCVVDPPPPPPTTGGSTDGGTTTGGPGNCAGTWSACDPSSKTRTFTITQQPSNGGTPCPASPESCTPSDCGPWTPPVSSVCSNEQVTQTNNCGKSQTVSGTKACCPKNTTYCNTVKAMNNGYLWEFGRIEYGPPPGCVMTKVKIGQSTEECPYEE